MYAPKEDDARNTSLLCDRNVYKPTNSLFLELRIIKNFQILEEYDHVYIINLSSLVASGTVNICIFTPNKINQDYK